MDILVDRPAPGIVRITQKRPEPRNALRAGAPAVQRQAIALAASHDRNQGIAAFLEKRPPIFTGD